MSTDKQESAWLIERYLFSELHFWTGDIRPSSRSAHGYESFSSEMMDAAFATDPDKAIRFARQEDATLILSRLLRGNGRVAQHVWADGELLA